MGKGVLKSLAVCMVLFCVTGLVYPQDAGSASETAVDGTDARSQQTLREEALKLGEDGGAAAPTGTGIFGVIRVIFVLVLAVLAIYGLAYMLKKGTLRRREENAHLRLLAAVPITAKTSAAVVSVGGSAWLVGVSDSGVTLISEIADRETVDAMILEYSRNVSASAPGRANFLGVLKKIIPALSGSEGGGKAGAPGASENLLKNRDRLRRL